MPAGGDNGPDLDRRHDDTRPDDYRDRFNRDCDRILYSSAFRRLNGVTQVVSADETQLFHNRLTHTLKVAQISRRIAEKLQAEHSDEIVAGAGLDPAAAEAAALAHDLGHPPFGHIAEDVLMECCDERGINGYEGNAQSFRIVTKLSWRSDKPGLNLTRRTLRAILKYPWLRSDEAGAADTNPDRHKKWGAYETEREDFEFAMAHGDEGQASLEAEIMDWADDITYAVHDLEDFYRAGLTPIARLDSDPDERTRFIIRASTSLVDYDRFDRDEAAESFTELVTGVISMPKPYSGSNSDRRLLHETSSVLISRFVDKTSVDVNGHLRTTEAVWHEVNMLKQLTWHYVINSPDLATIQEGQKAIIRGLFNTLMEWTAVEGNKDRLPTRLRELIKSLRDDPESVGVFESDEQLRTRAIADYIASLTEPQAVELFSRLEGLSQPSILHGWVRTQ